MKRLVFFVLIQCFGLITFSGLLDAMDGYSINFSQTMAVDRHGVCQQVTNHHPSGQTIFVPTRTAAEWTSFRSHHPAGVSFATCEPAECSSVGQSYQGGKCAETGANALIAANADSGSMTWSNALAACSGMGAGWYLPSISELYVLYVNRSAIGGFVGATYWSSSDSGTSGNVWTRWFTDGSLVNETKLSPFVRTRCVRRAG